MSAGKICSRIVVVAGPDDTVRDAARLMAAREVGTVVVVDERSRPLGIVTDRDITLRCIAVDQDPRTMPLCSVMSAPAAGVQEMTPIEDALSTMAARRTRRLVVTDAEGQLAGILSLDDVLDLLVEEVESVGRLLRKQR